MPIGAIVTMTAKPGLEKEALELLEEIIADVRTEPGNLLSVVLRDSKEPGTFYAFEIYRDEAAIAAHKIAPHSVNKGPKFQALCAGPHQSTLFETVDWPETLKVAS